LIKTIGKHAKVFVVGDPRQSIYQWRGSNERFFLDFDSYFDDVTPVEISENRRSTKNIVNISNFFSDHFDDVDYENMDSIRQEDGDVKKSSFESDYEEAVWIADQIENLVEEKGCDYSDFGILLRSVNTAGDPFIEIFRDRNIPYIVGGKVGLFKRPEAQAVGKILCWLWDDGFWVKNPYNWNDQIKGDELLISGLDNWNEAVDFPLPDNIIEQLEDWKMSVLSGKFNDFKRVFYELLVLLGYHNFELDNKVHLTCMANLGRFSALVRDYEIAIRLDKGTCYWSTECKNLCWFINSYASKSYEEQTVEDIRQVNAVQLMTVHQAKGLEWPVVFLPSLVKQRFPSSMAGRKRNWLFPRNLFDVSRYEGGLEEEKRLFYVALTRAKDKLVLSSFKKYKKAESQSEFLSTLDKFPIDNVDPYEYSIDYEPSETVHEDEIQTYSTTEIITYMRCPHHYRLNKLWEYIQDFSPLIGYGEALHFCLRQAAELIQDDGFDPVSAVATAVDENYFLPFASQDLTESTKRKARKSLIDFANKHTDDMEKIVEVESRLEFPIQDATLSGKVDVIMLDEDTYEIRDYKTSDEVVTEEDSELQLRLYSLGLRQTGWNIDSGSVAYLRDAKVEDVDVDPQTVNKSKSIAEEVISNISEDRFDPQPSDFCQDCEYNNICKWRKKQ